MSMSRVATARAAIAVLACAAFGVLAAPASAPHAAACVAALKAQEAGFAESVKAGEPMPADFLRVVRSGIAIIGSQYLAGLREAGTAAIDSKRMPASGSIARIAGCSASA